MKEFATTELIGKHRVVDEPQMIKIKTIKKKYLEASIPSRDYNITSRNEVLFPPEEIEILGKVPSHNCVLIRYNPGSPGSVSEDQIVKMSVSDYQLYLVDKMSAGKTRNLTDKEIKKLRADIWLKSVKMVDGLPQLFAD